MKPKDIKEILEKQRELIYSSSDTFEDIKYLQGNNAVGETKTQSEFELLQFYQCYYISNLMWNYLILELNKLYSKNNDDQFRFYGVLNTLLIKCSNPPYNHIISLKDSVVSLKGIMDGEEFAKHYRKIKSIRDEFVAHLAKAPSPIHIENEDVKYFLDLNDRILIEIIDPITCGGASIYSPPSTLRDFIKKMASYKGVYDKIEEGVRPGKITAETDRELRRILGKKSFVEDGIG